MHPQPAIGQVGQSGQQGVKRDVHRAGDAPAVALIVAAYVQDNLAAVIVGQRGGEVSS